MTHRPGAALLLLSALLCGCEMAETNRCPAGFEYDPSGRLCFEAHDDAESTDATSTDATSTDATSTDAASTDASRPGGGEVDGGETSGLGTTCTSNGECAAFAADYCAVNPMDGVGYCTYENCAPGGCPDGYQCCDCLEAGAGLGYTVFCMDDHMVRLILGSVCECE